MYPVAQRSSVPGNVCSPYQHNGLVNVQQFAAGDLVVDPFTKRVFRKPPRTGAPAQVLGGLLQERPATVRYRPDIDGLRALAVIGVIVYHFLPRVMPGGLTGVDVFFVISGYLISLILIKQVRLDFAVLRSFYARRIKRIFPALLVVMVCTFAFGWIALYADEFKELGKHIMAGAGFVSNFVFLKETGYFDASAEQKPLLHLWSLAVEEQFYIVWPLLLILLAKTERQRLAVKIMWLLSFAGNVYLSYTNVDVAYYLPFTRFWEILTGGVLAFSEVERKEGEIPTKKLGAEVGLVLLIGSLFLMRGEAHFPGWQAFIPVFGAYLVIRDHRSRTSDLLLANRPMVWLGLISYPLYLWHWPILAYLTITQLQPTALQKGIGLVLTLVLSALTYYLFEKRVRHRKGWTTAVLLILMTGIAFAGYKTYRRNGLEYRQVNYEVYKDKALAWLGLTPSAQISESSVKFDRHSFESLHPQYAEQLRHLALRMKEDSAFYQKIKHNFYAINQDALGRKDGAANAAEPKRRIVIIGDSHAENLYWALALTHPQFEFKLFAAAGCTPILSRYKNEDDRCRVLINSARDFLKREKTDLVILAARWPESYERVSEDLAFYKTVSPHVALAGPSLTFRTDVSKIMLRYRDGEDIIEHVNRFIDTDKFRQNAAMKSFAARENVGFIDKIETLSRDGICRITNSGDEFFIFDSSHLTKSGAVEVGGQLLHEGVVGDLLR
jgi:peptidoglycan/LPS O-acetylase OafA/YrhL